MSKTIKYTGTQDRWPELAYTGKQSVWIRGQTEERPDAEANALMATGLFKDMSLTAQEVSASVFFPPTDDYAGILIAANAALQAGGGIVQFKAIDYTLTGPLPLLKNVLYRGVGAPWKMFEHNHPGGGTRLIGDAQYINNKWVGGTFNAFEWNPADRAAPHVNEAAYKGSEQFGAGVRDLVIEGFAYGIKAGALYDGGCAQFRLDNVVVIRCSEWGVWMENCDAPQVGTVTCMDNQRGQFAYVVSGGNNGASWNYGDGHIHAIFAQSPRGNGFAHMRSKGLMFRCRGEKGDINDLLVSHIGVNGLNTTYTGVATMTSGVADIAVPDIGMFGVDSPVYFQTTAGGFTANRVYFVTQVSGDTGAGTIRLSQNVGGAVVTPNANATPTIVNHGYTLVEMSGGYGGSTGRITFSTFPHIDAESNGTAGIVMQGLNGCMVRSNSTVGNKGVVARACTRYNNLRVESSNTGLDVDDDSKKITLTGVVPLPAKIAWNMPCAVAFEDAHFGIAMYLAGLGTGGPDIWVGDTVWPAINMGRAVRHKTNTFAANYTWEKNHGDVQQYTGAGGHTFTLPAIVDVMVGIKVFVTNPSAGVLNVAASGGQNIVGDGVSATTGTIATLTNATFVACKVNGIFYWARF